MLFGEMVEWSITTVLKTVVPRGTGGSNPSLSANKGVNQQVMRFTPFITPENFGETIFTDCIENSSKDFCLRLWIIGFRTYWKIKIFGILLINMLRTSNNHHRLICIHFICKRFI